MKKVLVLLISFVFYVSAYAIEIKVPETDVSIEVYGELKLESFYTHSDKEQTDSGYQENEYNLDLQSDSTIGLAAHVTPDITAVIEWELDTLSAFYGEYVINEDLVLLAGKSSTGSSYGIDGQVAYTSNGQNNYGTLADIQAMQLSLRYKIFSFAIVSIPEDITDGLAQSAIGTNYTINSSMPRIDLAIEYSNDFVLLKAFSSYYQTDISNKNTDESLTLPAYHVGLGTQLTAGNFFANISGFYAVNAALYEALWEQYLPIYDPSAEDFAETKTTGLAISIGYNISNTMKLHTGYGYMTSSSDMFGDEKDNAQSYFINFTQWINDHVYYVAEFSVLDDMKDDAGAEQGALTSAGLQLNLVF
jgi:hypothetical protein